MEKTKTIPELVRALFRTRESFTAREVAAAAKSDGFSPARGVVATALWRMAMATELRIINAPNGGYWSGGKHRRYTFDA